MAHRTAMRGRTRRTTEVGFAASRRMATPPPPAKPLPDPGGRSNRGAGGAAKQTWDRSIRPL